MTPKTLSQLKKNGRREFDKEFFEEKPSNDTNVIKITTGNGPFAYRHACKGDIKTFLDTQITKAYQSAISDVLKIMPKKEDLRNRKRTNPYRLLSPQETYENGWSYGKNDTIDTITKAIEGLKAR